jgi:hypothetical protein
VDGGRETTTRGVTEEVLRWQRETADRVNQEVEEVGGREEKNKSRALERIKYRPELKQRSI